MDPCPFVRIVIGNLALLTTVKKTHPQFYCKLKVKGYPSQLSDISVLASESDPVETKVHGSFTWSRSDLEKLCDRSFLKIEVHSRARNYENSCGFLKKGKLLGCFVVPLDLKGFFENSGTRATVIRSGWVAGSDFKLHMNVRAEADPRFVFRFDGEPECSPQVFQVNGIVKQPVFSCKFGLRNSVERNLISRSSLSETSTSNSCFTTATSEKEQPLKERKGWSITIHDLSGSPVALASMVTPFVPSRGSDRVGKSNPGAWLILRPGQGTWKAWGRLEAWREHKGDDRLGYRFELMPDGGIDPIPLANSSISTKKGGKFSIEITNGPTPMASPNSSFDLGSGAGSGSGSDFGSASGSGSWVHLLYRGFVMSSTIEGDGKCSKPEIQVGVQHVTCTEDAAAFVALAAAVDLSMDACRLFSQKLRKELRQPDHS